jgi:hypothetical protein
VGDKVHCNGADATYADSAQKAPPINTGRLFATLYSNMPMMYTVTPTRQPTSINPATVASRTIIFRVAAGIRSSWAADESWRWQIVGGRF